jgi:hypothetical protein
LRFLVLVHARRIAAHVSISWRRDRIADRFRRTKEKSHPLLFDRGDEWL